MAVELMEYDPEWSAWFEAARAELAPMLGEAASIEHIGSTSVPGMAAQPIIDILVQLPALPLDWEPMAELRYGEQRGLGGVNQVFYRPEPRAKVYVAVAGSNYAADRLLFRDYLREHPERRLAYEALKADAAAAHPDNAGAYTAAKLAFVQETIAMASAAAPAEPDEAEQPD